MDGHIGIAMPQQSLLPGDFHSSEPQFPAFDKPMNVKSHPDTEHIAQQ
jgi:hypothetical protein